LPDFSSFRSIADHSRAKACAPGELAAKLPTGACRSAPCSIALAIGMIGQSGISSCNCLCSLRRESNIDSTGRIGGWCLLAAARCACTVASARRERGDGGSE